VPILCEPASSAGELLSGIDGEVRKADTLAAAAKLLDSDPHETLVIIGPRAVTGDALAFAASLRLARPAVGVILARREVDVTLLMRALQSGVRDVVPVGDDAAMAAACRRSYEVTRRMLAPPAEEESVPGQIVTVFAAKGGCGKTALAVNIGVALARQGVGRVCVVDLDLAFGDVAISVQLDPLRTIVDALPMAGHLDESGAASLLTRYQPGLDMLLAPVTPGDAEKIPPRLVGELLAVLRGMYNFVVVDTPAQFS
jgi:Flp pilus assembly CpaE family ATPase